MKWQKLAYAGSFAGHPGGKFEMTPQTFSEIEKNFKTEGLDVVFDYEHASEMSVAESPAKGRGEAIASGWIRDVQARPDGLYGLVAWTDKAYSMLKNQEVRYISPAIRFGSKDKVTGAPIGAKLSSAALCQKPFLSSLPPALASDPDTTAFLCSEITPSELVTLAASSGSYAMHANEFLPRFRRILNLDDMASPEDMMAKVDRLAELCEMADGDSMATVQGVNLGSYIPQLRDYMRMPANTTLADMLDAVCEMICSTMDSEGADMADTVSADAPITVTTLTSPAPVLANETIKTMSEPQTILLSEHTVKLSEAVANAVKDAVSPLNLQLKDETSAKLKALADVAEANAKLVTLTEQIATRDAAVSSARVADAFDTYKELKKLSDDDKEAMAITLSTKPDLFEKLYPKLSADKKPLLRTIAASDTTDTSKVGTTRIVDDLAKCLSDVQAKNPNLPYDKQFDMAMTERAKQLAV